MIKTTTTTAKSQWLMLGKKINEEKVFVLLGFFISHQYKDKT